MSDHQGNKIGIGYRDGTSRYTQSAQAGPAYLMLADAPADDPVDHCFVSIPDGITPVAQGDWLTMTVGPATIAVRGVGAQAAVGVAELAEKQQKDNEQRVAKGQEPRHKPAPIIRIPGRRVGFVVEVLDTTDAAAVAAALQKTQLDAGRLAADRSVTYTTTAGRRIEMTMDPSAGDDAHADRMAKVTLDGEPVTLDGWPIASGPYVRQAPGVLTVNDGREGFEVDFTGERPVYRAWKP